MADGDINVQITATITDLLDKMQQAQNAIRQAADGMKDGMSDAGDAAKGLGDELSKAFMVAEITIAYEAIKQVTEAIYGFASAMADLGDKAGIMSKELGMSVEEVTAFAYAAGLVDVSGEGAARMLERLERNMTAAQSGTGMQAAAFRSLGITTDELKNKYTSLDSLLPVIADKFAATADGPAKTAIAISLFGRAGADMIPILDQGAAGLDQLKQHATDLGVVLDGPTAAAMTEVHDKLYDIGQAIEGGAITAFMKMKPTIVALIDDFTAFVQQVKATVTSTEAVEQVWNPLIAIGTALWNAVTTVWTALEKVATSLGVTSTASSTLSGAFELLLDVLKLVATAIDATAAWIGILGDDIKTFVDESEILIHALGQAFIDVASLDMSKAAADWDDALQKIEDSEKTHAANVLAIETKLHNDVKAMRDSTDIPSVTITPKVKEPDFKPQLDAPVTEKKNSAAQKAAEELATIEEKAAAERIKREQQTDDTLLKLGLETYQDYENNTIKHENELYNIQMQAIDRKEKADAGDKAKLAQDEAEREVLTQQHLARLEKITDDAMVHAQKVRDEDLKSFINDQEAELSAALKGIDDEYKAHEISAQDRRDMEVALTRDIEAQVLARFDADHASLVKGTDEWRKAMTEREALVRKFNADVIKADTELRQEEQAQWTTLTNSIENSFKSAIDGMLFQGKTFAQGMQQIASGILQSFVDLGMKMLTDWIKTLALELLHHNTTQAAKTASTVAANTAQTTAVTAGQVAQTTAVGAAQAAQTTAVATAQVAQAAALIASSTLAMQAAVALAGANGVASFALAPWPIDVGAPEFGASMAAAAGAFAFAGGAGFAQGAWDIPGDMNARIHQGEMILPKPFAEDFRNKASANGGGGSLGGGGDTVHVHITAMDAQSVQRLFDNNSSALVTAFAKAKRNNHGAFTKMANPT